MEVLPVSPDHKDWSLHVFPHIKPREMRQPTYNPISGETEMGSEHQND